MQKKSINSSHKALSEEYPYLQLGPDGHLKFRSTLCIISAHVDIKKKTHRKKRVFRDTCPLKRLSSSKTKSEKKKKNYKNHLLLTEDIIYFNIYFHLVLRLILIENLFD